MAEESLAGRCLQPHSIEYRGLRAQRGVCLRQHGPLEGCVAPLCVEVAAFAARVAQCWSR